MLDHDRNILVLKVSNDLQRRLSRMRTSRLHDGRLHVADLPAMLAGQRPRKDIGRFKRLEKPPSPKSFIQQRIQTPGDFLPVKYPIAV